jgi:chromate transporter
MAPVREVVREWGRIGVVGFGGPPAHVALLRDLCVTRRGWIGAREFEDANAACGLLPGPASTQLAIYCARRVGGLRGALAGGLAFILPGLVLLVALAALTLQAEPPRWVRGLAEGAGAAAVAVVAQAAWDLARAGLAPLRGARLARAVAYLVAGVVVVLAGGAWVVLVLLACGLIELALRHGPGGLGPPLLSLAPLPAVAWTALKVGALSYGGGFVIVPLLQGDAVDAHGWMTQAQFLNAVALGQLTPGPVTQTVSAVGWAADGLTGAAVAAVFAFAPSFVLVLALFRHFERLREAPSARAFLDGAGPAAIGAIAGAGVTLLDGVHTWWQWVVLAAAAIALLVGRAGVVPVLVAAALAGFAAGVGGGTM